VAAVCVGALIASAVAAFRRPAIGIPAFLGVAVACAALMRWARKREIEEDARRVDRLRATAAPSGAAWERLLTEAGLGRHVPGLRPAVRSAVRLETARADAVPPGQSRIGGAPDLPADFEWPSFGGKPLLFLAQLDLAEVRRTHASPLLPEGGTLWFFYSDDQPWGFDPKDAGGHRVVYRPPGTPLTPSAPAAGPPSATPFPACRLTFVAYDDLPELDTHPLPGAAELEQEAYIEAREYLASGGGSSSHKLLGHANVVQHTMELECELVANGLYCGDASGYADPRAKALEASSREWRLLLQLDSDDTADMMWGDLGRVYFWIREADLRDGRFEKTWLVLQCH
jgi:uncharacterized protein YwqG